MVLLTVFLAVIAFQVQDLRLVDKNKTTGDGESVLVYRDLPENYFQPTSKPASTPATQLASLDLGALDTSLYSYLGNKTANASTGVVTAGATARGGLIDKANASSPYPVVYVTYTTNNIPQLIEVNVQTGKNKVLTSEEAGSAIYFIDFSQTKQVVGYGVRKNAQSETGVTVIKQYNLNDGTTKDIFTTATADSHIYTIKWSPDGETLAWSEQYYIKNDPSTNYNTLNFYTLASGEIKSYSYNKYIVNQPMVSYYQADNFSWTADSASLVIGLRKLNISPIITDAVVKISRQDGSEVVTSGALNTNNHTVGTVAVANYMVGITYNPNNSVMLEKQTEASKTYNTYGWLYRYDTTPKSTKEYNATMGDSFDPNYGYLITKDAKTAVFIKAIKNSSGYRDSELYSMNLDSGELKKLQYPTDGGRIVGWAGNEKNVLLWGSKSTFYVVNLETGKYSKVTK